MLNDLFLLLSGEQKAKVLAAATPTDGLPPEEVATQPPETVADQLREWTPGNLFEGPNTSIRIDPTDEQDVFDSDAQHIIDAKHYKELEAYNTRFIDFINLSKRRRGAGGPPLSESEAKKLTRELVKFYNYAKRQSRTSYKATQWREVTDVRTMNEVLAERREGLEKEKRLDNIYFRIAFAETGGLILDTRAGGYAYQGKLLTSPVTHQRYIFVKKNSSATNRQAIEDLLVRRPGSIAPYAVVPQPKKS
jgi:hypothetical protein